ncbi:MAG: AAA family ATPase [Actinobacteria bacterium]|nr:AAA family ATPase [Actinomycetota bacterium]
MRLLGRERERSALAALLEAAGAGRGAALVLVGDAGAGKTALLRQAAREAGDVRVLWPARATLQAGGGASLPAGLTMLRGLVRAGQGGPLLCLVDDADRLDPAARAALAVAARRVATSPVVMLLAVRSRALPFADLPSLPLGGLNLPSAGRLLHRLTGGALDRPTSDRLTAAVGGNPGALTDLATRYPAAELGRIALAPDPAPVDASLLRYFGADVLGLPADTRSLLLALAAAPDRDVNRAGPVLGFDAGSWRPAVRAGLVAGWPQPRFTHPLTRSAVYYGAPPGQRRRVHGVVAGLPGSPGSRAWHRATGARPGPDEALATELADTALTVARVPERCLLLVLAGERSADPGTRAIRHAAAARAALAAGASSYAEVLAAQALVHLRHDPAARARTAATREQARQERGQPGGSASAWLLRAARTQRAAAPAAARDSTLAALSQLVLAGDSGRGTTKAAAAALARQIATLSDPADSGRPLGTLLLRGFGQLAAGDYEPAAGFLRQALAMTAEPALLAGEIPDWFPLAAVGSLAVWDDTAGVSWLERVAERARATGALQQEKLARSALRSCGSARISPVVTALGQRRFAAALRVAVGICARDVLHLEQQVLPYLVEAAAAGGQLRQARAALMTLRARAAVAGTDWVRGQLHCSEGILADDERADAAFGAAIGSLRRTSRTAEVARAHLLYGEALTRQGRSGEGGHQLRTAMALFSESTATFGEAGAAAWASRARLALRAAGERPASRGPSAGDELTDQELRIARLAASGATNRDIGSQLFIGASTVDYHLHKIYRKLGVSSRRDLSGGLCVSADSRRPPPP